MSVWAQGVTLPRPDQWDSIYVCETRGKVATWMSMSVVQSIKFNVMCNSCVSMYRRCVASSELYENDMWFLMLTQQQDPWFFAIFGWKKANSYMKSTFWRCTSRCDGCCSVPTACWVIEALFSFGVRANVVLEPRRDTCKKSKSSKPGFSMNSLHAGLKIVSMWLNYHPKMIHNLESNRIRKFQNLA